MQVDRAWEGGRLLVELRSRPQLTAELGGKVVGTTAPTYEGDYMAVSSLGGEDKLMETANKLMVQDVVVKAITISETSNPAGGTTILIKE